MGILSGRLCALAPRPGIDVGVDVSRGTDAIEYVAPDGGDVAPDARRAGAEVVVVDIPFPLGSAQQALNEIDAAVTERTRIAMVDHVTIATALVLPIDQIVSRLEERGVPVLVDGAHAPGMVPLDVEALGASYYTGNCHKWPCAPKGAAFVPGLAHRVNAELRQALHQPQSVSEGAGARQNVAAGAGRARRQCAQSGRSRR